MTTVTALSPDDVSAVGIGVIVVLVVVGLALVAFISKLVVRVLVAIVVIVLGVLVWQQRDHVRNEINTRACNLDTTFFGIHVDPPEDVTRACASRS